MKKIVIMLMSVVMIASMVSCGSDSSDEIIPTIKAPELEESGQDGGGGQTVGPPPPTS